MTAPSDPTALLARIAELEQRIAALESVLTIESRRQFQLGIGDSSLIMNKYGGITLTGDHITLFARGKISVKASSDVTIKGSKILQN